MEAGAVAFMAGEAVAGVLEIQGAHEGIPGGLGEDGGAGDSERETVSFYQGGLGEIEGGEEQDVGEEVIRGEGERGRRERGRRKMGRRERGRRKRGRWER